MWINYFSLLVVIAGGLCLKKLYTACYTCANNIACTFVLTCFSNSFCAHAVQGSTACSFGNDLTQLTSSTQTGLIMNTANPAQCPGNATTWNLCYYRSTSTSTVYLGVYRPATRYSSSYSLVFRSYYTIPQALSSYSCSDFSIPQSQQFTIQVYDVIAACVQPSASGHSIVASTSGSSIIISTANMCGQLSSALPNNIITTSGFSSKSIALHVSLGMSY